MTWIICINVNLWQYLYFVFVLIQLNNNKLLQSSPIWAQEKQMN